MQCFKILPSSGLIKEEGGKLTRCAFLRKPIDAFFHADYIGGGNWKIEGTIENWICTLKNDITRYPDETLKNAQTHLKEIMISDLPKIREYVGMSLVVCVIPRSKAEHTYRQDQKLFRATVQEAIHDLPGFIDGTSFIIRHTNTKTTHLARSSSSGDGEMPYPGITRDTCRISDEVVGKNILLIDDLYTKTVNIDEDAIQALLDKGAESVYFYSIGKTTFAGNTSGFFRNSVEKAKSEGRILLVI